METRIVQVRKILDKLADDNGGFPYHDGKGRFWNLPRDAFIAGPIYGKTPIVPRDKTSFLLRVLAGPSDGIARMPPGGPYISGPDLDFITQWVVDGAPDADPAFMSAFSLHAGLGRRRR
jgi:hypothetical protein